MTVDGRRHKALKSGGNRAVHLNEWLLPYSSLESGRVVEESKTSTRGRSKRLIPHIQGKTCDILERRHCAPPNSGVLEAETRSQS